LQMAQSEIASLRQEVATLQEQSNQQNAASDPKAPDIQKAGGEAGWGDDFDFDLETPAQEPDIKKTADPGRESAEAGWGDFDLDVEGLGGSSAASQQCEQPANGEVLQQLEAERVRCAELTAEVEQLKESQKKQCEEAAETSAREADSLRFAKEELLAKEKTIEELRSSQSELDSLRQELTLLREASAANTTKQSPLASPQDNQKTGGDGWGDDFDVEFMPTTDDQTAAVATTPATGQVSTDESWGDFDLDVDVAPQSTKESESAANSDILRQLEEEQRRAAELATEVERLKAAQQQDAEMAASKLAQEEASVAHAKQLEAELQAAKEAAFSELEASARELDLKTQAMRGLEEELAELRASKEQVEQDASGALMSMQQELDALKNSKQELQQELDASKSSQQDDSQKPPLGNNAPEDDGGWGDFDLELDDSNETKDVQDTGATVNVAPQPANDSSSDNSDLLRQLDEEKRISAELAIEVESLKAAQQQDAETAKSKLAQEEASIAHAKQLEAELQAAKDTSARELEESARDLDSKIEAIRKMEEELAGLRASKEHAEKEASEALKSMQQELDALKSSQQDLSQQPSSGNNVADDGGWGDFDVELDDSADKKNVQDASVLLEKKIEELQLAQSEIASLRQEVETLRQDSAKQNTAPDPKEAPEIQKGGGEEGWGDDFDFDLETPAQEPSAAKSADPGQESAEADWGDFDLDVEALASPPAASQEPTSEVLQQLEVERVRCAELVAEVEQLKNDVEAQKKHSEAAEAASAREAESLRLAKEELETKEKMILELQSNEAELEKLKSNQVELDELRQELAALREASNKNQPSLEPQLPQDNRTSADDGWGDDFDIDLEPTTSNQASAGTRTAPVTGQASADEGWGDFDLDVDVAPNSAKDSENVANGDVLRQLDDEQRRSAELVAEVERLKAAQKQDAEIAASKLAQEEASAARAQQLVAELQLAKDELGNLQSEVATLREEASRRNEEADKKNVVPSAEIAEDDGWGDFDIPDDAAPEAVSTAIPGDTGSAQTQEDAALLEAQKESLRLRDVLRQSEEHAENLQKEIVALRASSQPTPSTGSKAEAFPTNGAKDDAGWDDFDDFVDESETKLVNASNSAAENVELKAKIDELTAKLIVASGRIKHAEDEKLAGERVHSPQATAALRSEVAKLSEALVVERQERQREENQLRQSIRQAQEDLRQQRVLADGADTAVLLDQIDALRKQRNQARSIAQCIMQQTTSLADEVYRLRTTGVSSNSVSGIPVPATSEEEAHPPAAERPASVEVTRDRPEEPEQQRRDINRIGSFLGGLGAAFSGFIEREVADLREGVESQHPPRPPDEVTSGWDVFDPDDQIENTEPTAPAVGITNGWGDDDGDLFEGFPDPVDAATADMPPGHPPELSSMSSPPPTGTAEAGSMDDDFFADLM